MKKVDVLEMENMEITESFAEVIENLEGNEIVVLAESGMMENLASEEEEEEEMEEGESETEVIEEESKSVVMKVGGYNRDKPPGDDCCPICFDAFVFPCRTSCGHWFCSVCILQYWKFSANYKPCKCPICGSLIVKLEPESPTLPLSGEANGKVLKDIRLYNRLTVGGLSGVFLKILAFPVLTRRRLLENWNPMILRCAYLSRMVGVLLGYLYDYYDFHFFPNGSLGIQNVLEISSCTIFVLYCVDFLWHRWKLRRRARRLDQQHLVW